MMAAKKANKKFDGGASRAFGRKKSEESRNRQGIKSKQENTYGLSGAYIHGQWGPMSPIERKAKGATSAANTIGASKTWGRMPDVTYGAAKKNKKKK